MHVTHCRAADRHAHSCTLPGWHSCRWMLPSDRDDAGLYWRFCGQIIMIVWGSGGQSPPREFAMAISASGCGSLGSSGQQPQMSNWWPRNGVLDSGARPRRGSVCVSSSSLARFTKTGSRQHCAQEIQSLSSARAVLTSRCRCRCYPRGAGVLRELLHQTTFQLSDPFGRIPPSAHPASLCQQSRSAPRAAHTTAALPAASQRGPSKPRRWSRPTRHVSSVDLIVTLTPPG